MHDHHHCRKKTFWDRRDFLMQSGGGIAGLALAHMLDQQGVLAAAQSDTCEAPVPGNPFAPQPSHFEPRATAVISLFMSGGVSQVDTFDPKQALIDYAGQPMAESVVVRQGHPGPLMSSPFGFKKHGQSGIEVSDIFPHIPVTVINEEESPGLKRGGVLNLVRREIEVICTVGNIPSEFVLDLTGMEIGDSAHISQVKLPEGVVPVIADRDFTVATVASPTVVREEAAAEAEAAAAALLAAELGEGLEGLEGEELEAAEGEAAEGDAKPEGEEKGEDSGKDAKDSKS